MFRASNSLGFEPSFQRISSEIFENASYRGDNGLGLLLGQRSFVLLDLRVASIVSYVCKLDHVPRAFVYNFKGNSELIIQGTLPIDIDESGISVNVFNFGNANPAEVVHLPR